MAADRERRQRQGVLAALVTIGSALLGGAYYAYLVAVPFPPDVVRLVPMVWFIASAAGLVMGMKAVRGEAARYLGALALVVGLPNILLAATFAFAACMGG